MVARDTDAAGMAGSGPGDIRDAAKETIDSMAKALRATARQLEDDEPAAARHDVGDAPERLQSLGWQLRETDVDALIHDAQDLGRRAPGMFFARSVVAGVLPARFLKASPELRRDDRRDPGEAHPGPDDGPGAAVPARQRRGRLRSHPRPAGPRQPVAGRTGPSHAPRARRSSARSTPRRRRRRRVPRAAPERVRCLRRAWARPHADHPPGARRGDAARPVSGALGRPFGIPLHPAARRIVPQRRARAAPDGSRTVDPSNCGTGSALTSRHPRRSLEQRRGAPA
ncbi:MAG: hypothetical protein O9972_00435, partial [Burkholderiales bacterium]|nr:hypothetical protein [Burkholderiales bacterium]